MLMYIISCSMGVDTPFQVMDPGESYRLETKSGSKTPKSSSDTPLMSNINNTYLTPFNNKISLANSALYTPVGILFEKTSNDCIRNELNDTIYSELNDTTLSKRKRTLSAANDLFMSKRKKELYYSEESKRKISDLFRTPMQYFTSRRKTVNDINVDDSFAESVSSTSGLFEVETIQNLSELTPNNTRINMKRVRKKLFTRSFVKNAKKCLNTTKLPRESSELHYNEQLNISCFPEISSLSIKHNHCEAPCGKLDLGEPTLNHCLVLTSFHSHLRTFAFQPFFCF